MVAFHLINLGCGCSVMMMSRMSDLKIIGNLINKKIILEFSKLNNSSLISRTTLGLF